MITTEVVTYFAKAARRATLWERARLKYRKIIYDGLLAGEQLPLDGPYTVDISETGAIGFSWEQAYENLLAKVLREKYEYSRKDSHILARERMDAMKEKAKPKTVIKVNGVPYIGGLKLEPKVNSNLKQDLPEGEEE